MPATTIRARGGGSLWRFRMCGVRNYPRPRRITSPHPFGLSLSKPCFSLSRSEPEEGQSLRQAQGDTEVCFEFPSTRMAAARSALGRQSRALPCRQGWPRLWRSTCSTTRAPSTTPIGGASRWWLHHSLESLSNSLAKRHAKLILRRGDAVEELRKLAEEVGATAIHANCHYEPFGG